MTPAQELAAAADKLASLIADATDGPWSAEASSCINRLPGGIAEEFVAWDVSSPVIDDEGGRTAVAAVERDPRDESLWGGIWNPADAAYIAAMNPLVGKALAEWLRDMVSDTYLGSISRGRALAIARLVNGGGS